MQIIGTRSIFPSMFYLQIVAFFVFPHEPENFYPPLPIEIPDTTGLPNLEGKGGITIAGRIYYKVPKDIEEGETQPFRMYWFKEMLIILMAHLLASSGPSPMRMIL